MLCNTCRTALLIVSLAAPAAAAVVAPAASGTRLPGLTVRGDLIYFADDRLAGRFLAWGGEMDCTSMAVECRVHPRTLGRTCQRSMSRGLGCPRCRWCGGCLQQSCGKERLGGDQRRSPGQRKYDDVPAKLAAWLLAGPDAGGREEHMDLPRPPWR